MRNIVFFACLAALAACSKKAEPAPPPAAPATPAQTAAPAPAAAAAPAAGNFAAEKHRLHISNWPKVAVTATLNGEWIGQWDSDTTVPLAALKGKNDLLLEVGGEPKSDITVIVQAERSGSWVNLLSFNYKDKPGKHEAAFVAK